MKYWKNAQNSLR